MNMTEAWAQLYHAALLVVLSQNAKPAKRREYYRAMRGQAKKTERAMKKVMPRLHRMETRLALSRQQRALNNSPHRPACLRG